MRLMNAAGLLPDDRGEPLLEWWRVVVLLLIPPAGFAFTHAVVG